MSTETLEVGDSIDSETTESANVIEVEDRSGETHTFVDIPERFAEAEKYVFIRMFYDKYGSILGNAEPSSSIYNRNQDKYPNKWIGQSDENPRGSLGNAESPLAFLYSRYGAEDPKKEAKDSFYEVLEEEYGITTDGVTIEDYKANFPERKALWMNNQDMTKVDDSPVQSRQHKPWEDFYLPTHWVNHFGEEIPIHAEEETEDETEDETEEEEEEMNRGNYDYSEETEEESEEEEDEFDADEFRNRVENVNLSGLEDKKEKAAAIVYEIPELQKTLAKPYRTIVMDVLDTSKTTVYDGKDLWQEHGDIREEVESEDDQTEEENDETMTKDNTGTEEEEMGQGTKVLNLAVEHKPEKVLDLLLEEQEETVLETVASQYEEELTEIMDVEEEQDEEEMVDELFKGL